MVDVQVTHNNTIIGLNYFRLLLFAVVIARVRARRWRELSNSIKMRFCSAGVHFRGLSYSDRSPSVRLPVRHGLLCATCFWGAGIGHRHTYPITAIEA